MVDRQAADGLSDLERELTCPICTDVLYQPLTVLDCLHTCCASCLREWFAWQASKATTSSPYTCPSCRASVRGTRPNATVTTLLDLLLRQHPEKAKSQEEKDAIAKVYKPGDDVTPPVDVETESEDSADEATLAQARYLSLRDMDQDRARRRVERTEHNNRTRQHHAQVARNPVQLPPGRRSEPAAAALPPRHRIEHQSSLRSLLSASDIDDEELREDIMRQITDDGLLDGLDLANMTPAQEEEVIERIARAMQHRQSSNSPRPSSARRHDRPAPSRDAGRTLSPGAHRGQHSHRHGRPPPLSRPRLLGVVAPDTDVRRGHRSTSRSSQRSHTSTVSNDQAPRPSPAHGGSRSVTDLSSTSHPDPTERRPRRSSHTTRSATDPDSSAFHPQSRLATAASTGRATSPSPDSRPRHLSPQQRSASPLPTSHAVHAPPSRDLRQTSASDPTSSVHAQASAIPTRSSRHTTIPPPDRRAPSISCSRCRKPDIQMDIHYNCARCDRGDFHLCIACYRAGKGCKYWFGFGYQASVRFHRSDLPPDASQPHILSARRYINRQENPTTSNAVGNSPFGLPVMEAGLFCEGCHRNANTCYWHCETCLDGAWGYCQPCVARGQHCTHPLEAMALQSLLCPDTESLRPPSPPTTRNPPSRSPSPTLGANFSFISSTTTKSHAAAAAASVSSLHSTVRVPSILRIRTKLLPHLPNPDAYAPLLLPCACDLCHRPIPSSTPRYHCPTCSDGDYDICSDCYSALVPSGKLSPTDGTDGWRRCPRGHRTAVIGFEERERGLRRLVLRDLVGGHALEGSPDDDGDIDDDKGNVAAAPRPGWRWKELDGRQATAPARHQDLARSRTLINVQRSATITTAGNADSAHGHNGVGQENGAAAAAAAAATATLLPPDGGAGMRVLALWSYWAPGGEDELAFPRAAEVREVEDINGDWFWGVYAGRKGLFPGNYGRVVAYS